MTVVNPFQQINAALPPLAPAPAPAPAPAFDPTPLPGVSDTPPQMPQGKRPQVFGPTPQDRQETMLGGRLEKDYQKDLHPWGTPENHPGVWGKIGHAVSVATGGPNRRLMEESGLEGRLNKLAELQSQLGEQGAQTSHLKEETAEMPGKAESEEGLQGAETEEAQAKIANGPDLATAYAHAVNQAIKNGQDPAQDPIVQHLSDAITGLQKQPASKGREHVNLQDGKHAPFGGSFDPETGKYFDGSGNEIAKPVPYEKPSTVNVNAGNAEMDREATRLGKPYEKGASDTSAQLDKIADARAMVNGNAESQALGIPKVLTALVSGQGSGVRITQAELNMIGKARGIAGDVVGTLNKLAGQGSLSKAQQQQLTQILDDVKARVEKKAAVHSAALDAINGAGSREQIIQADKQARQQLQQIEKYGHYEGEQVTVKGQPVVIKKIHPDGSFE